MKKKLLTLDEVLKKKLKNKNFKKLYEEESKKLQPPIGVFKFKTIEEANAFDEKYNMSMSKKQRATFKKFKKQGLIKPAKKLNKRVGGIKK